MADRLRHAASSPADIDQVDIAADRELVERFQLGDEAEINFGYCQYDPLG